LAARRSTRRSPSDRWSSGRTGLDRGPIASPRRSGSRRQ
jgi:hypothetical protein